MINSHIQSNNVVLIAVQRHQGRLIFLDYQGEGDIDSTVFLVGKGMTYDTGGLDIKSKFIYILFMTINGKFIV